MLGASPLSDMINNKWRPVKLIVFLLENVWVHQLGYSFFHNQKLSSIQIVLSSIIHVRIHFRISMEKYKFKRNSQFGVKRLMGERLINFLHLGVEIMGGSVR